MADQHDIELSIINLQAKRQQLGGKKLKAQNEISRLREMLKFVQQGHETFNDLVEMKRKQVEMLTDIESELADLKTQIKKRQVLKQEVGLIASPRNIAVEADILVLRDKYLSFAGDRTRISSMREMAAKFAEELTKILKKVKS